MSWTLDSTHTTIEFSVRHMGISTVKGTFHEVSGEAEIDPENPTKSRGRVEIAIESIDTRNEQRDNHLRSADFFDAAQHPKAVFDVTAVRHLRDDRYEVDGELTIRGATRPITLRAELSEFITDPWGNQRAAVTVEGEINRGEFGLGWNQILEAGRLMVSEKVKLFASTEVVLPVAAAA
jgi:polyisoprenoid-binding protein YceI